MDSAFAQRWYNQVGANRVIEAAALLLETIFLAEVARQIILTPKMVSNLTQLLLSAKSGDQQARAELVRLAYDDLHSLAQVQMANQSPGHTLTTTALVNEVSIKLLEKSQTPSGGRAQFLAFASTAMRNVLIDHARAKCRQKRGGGLKPVQLEEALVAAQQQPEELLDLHEALERFAEIDQRRSRVVEMRYFGGMSLVETAEALDVSVGTVKRDWEVARLWLLKELQAGQIDEGETDVD